MFTSSPVIRATLLKSFLELQVRTKLVSIFIKEKPLQSRCQDLDPINWFSIAFPGMVEMSAVKSAFYLELVWEEVSSFIFNTKPKILNPLLVPFIIQT